MGARGILVHPSMNSFDIKHLRLQGRVEDSIYEEVAVVHDYCLWIADYNHGLGGPAPNQLAQMNGQDTESKQVIKDIDS